MGSKIVVNNYGSFDVTMAYGKGSTCYDVNGKKYIDFLWGIKYNVSRYLKGAGRWQNAEGLR